MSANFFRNTNGNTANAAKKIDPAEQHLRRNEIGIGDVELFEMPGRFEGEGADEADSGIQSNEKIFVRASSSATSSSARPNTGDGLAIR